VDHPLIDLPSSGPLPSPGMNTRAPREAGARNGPGDEPRAGARRGPRKSTRGSESADWHVHTHLSDGLVSPAEVIAAAARLGLTRIAITDHDGIDAHLDPRLPGIASAAGIDLLTGVEIDCTLGDLRVEVLGYGFVADAASPLAARLERVQIARRERLNILTEGLVAAGEPLDPATVLPPETVAPLKVHLYRALIRGGRSFPGGYAGFKALLASLGPSPEIPVPTLAEAVALVRGAGGFCVLAHPLYYLRAYAARELLMAVQAVGCEGSEFLYPYDLDAEGLREDTVRAGLKDLQAALRLAFPGGGRRTAGSDVHDPAEWSARLECVRRWRREFPG